MQYIEKYAQLVVKIGLNVTSGDNIKITSPVENKEFSEILTKECYLCGANNVIVDYVNEKISRLKYEYEKADNFKSISSYIVNKNNYLVENDYKLISIKATDPELLKGIEQSKISDEQLAYSNQCKNLIKKTMNNETSWCVVSIPTYNWARKIFPNSDDPEKLLWQAIFKVTRCDQEDPIMAFNQHIKRLENISNFLNASKFEQLHFKSTNGTDLTVQLVSDHIWTSAQSINNSDKSLFVANIPTEECFTLPKKNGVNGIVYSTKPLNYGGNLIEEFWFEFKDGMVVDYDAKVGYEALESLLNTDENSKYLGEVALVDKMSPINQLDIMFYNTLFDENASCHLALGRAYPTSLVGGENMSDDELKANYANDSAIHVDFMFGNDFMSVTGMKNGISTVIMQEGSFVK